MLLCHHSHLLPAPQSAEEALPHLDCWLDCLPGWSHLDWCCWYLGGYLVCLYMHASSAVSTDLPSAVSGCHEASWHRIFSVTVSAKWQAVLCLCGVLLANFMSYCAAKYRAHWPAALRLVLKFFRTGVVDALCSTQQLGCLRTALAMAKWSFPLALASIWSDAHSSLCHLYPLLHSGHACFSPCRTAAEQAAGSQLANQRLSKLNMYSVVRLVLCQTGHSRAL